MVQHLVAAASNSGKAIPTYNLSTTPILTAHNSRSQFTTQSENDLLVQSILFVEPGLYPSVTGFGRKYAP